MKMFVIQNIKFPWIFVGEMYPTHNHFATEESAESAKQFESHKDAEKARQSLALYKVKPEWWRVAAENKRGKK